MIDERDRAIRRVHRANDSDVRWNLKLSAPRKREMLVAVFQEIHELSKHLREVRAIDLVDDEDGHTRRVFGSLATEVNESSRNHLILELPGGACRGPKPLYKIFIRVSGME